MKRKNGWPHAGSTNPLVNFATIVVGAVVAAGALLLGFLTFTFLAGLLLVVACIVAIRIWWIRHFVLRRETPPGGRKPDQNTPAAPVTIEGEFRSVNDKDSTG